jgi:quercetin dioxygenase-like cupin family protein
MIYSVTEGHVVTEAEALAEIEARGWHGFVRDVVVDEDEELHWHDFDALVYVLEGTARAATPTGIVEAGPGALAEAKAGWVHGDVAGTTYRGVFGFSVDPASMTHPINKPRVDIT